MKKISATGPRTREVEVGVSGGGRRGGNIKVYF